MHPPANMNPPANFDSVRLRQNPRSIAKNDGAIMQTKECMKFPMESIDTTP